MAGLNNHSTLEGALLKPLSPPASYNKELRLLLLGVHVVLGFTLQDPEASMRTP